jgi:hypothetical protein
MTNKHEEVEIENNRSQSGTSVLEAEESKPSLHSSMIERRQRPDQPGAINRDEDEDRTDSGAVQTGQTQRTVQFARKETEIVVHLKNEPASIGEVTVAATSPNVEILASCFYWQRNGAVVRLVSEDPARTAQALARAGFQYQTDSVLLIGLQERPGIAARTGLLLATAGIAVSYSYVSRTDRHKAFAVFKTTDDDRALRLLQTTALVEEMRRRKAWPALSHQTVGQPGDGRLVA